MRRYTSWNNGNNAELAQTAPNREIPALEAVIDPIRLRKTLRFLSGHPFGWGTLGDLQVRILRCHKGRCVLEIVLCTATGVRTLIGKVYDTDVVGIFQAMERIAQAGFVPAAEFSIPEPIAYLGPLYFLLQEKVEGRLAKDIFLNGRESDRDLAAERCARWLARFQTVAPKVGPLFDPEAYLGFLEQCWRGVSPEDPLAGKVTDLFRCLKRAAPAMERVDACACHGDYGPIQVILANERTATCDWDCYGVSDPHRDVARFLVQLERFSLKRCGSVHALDRSAKVFLETYGALAGPCKDVNLHFYKAANHLKWTTEKLHKPHWRAGIEVALEESIRSLEIV